ncbi:MAG: hypothetical protein JWN00_2905 [Actinomycetia bacterium]|nr:hypothetical protein [Actinomycetes bacterium]
MKNRIHPDYQPVVFRDRGGDLAFLTRSEGKQNTV